MNFKLWFELPVILGSVAMLIVCSYADAQSSKIFPRGDFVKISGIPGIEIQRHELTYGQYERLNHPSSDPRKFLAEKKGCFHYFGSEPTIKSYGSNFPVVCVLWSDIQAYLKKLNEIDEEYEYRLPTDLELKSLIALTLEQLKSEDGIKDETLKKHAWYLINSGEQAHEVCTKNKILGLCDVLGNVNEMTKSTTPNGINRIYRGGSWLHGVRYKAYKEKGSHPGDQICIPENGEIGGECYVRDEHLLEVANRSEERAKATSFYAEASNDNGVRLVRTKRKVRN